MSDTATTTESSSAPSGFKPLPPKTTTTGRRIKYLGTSDIRRLEVGENLLSTQQEGLIVNVEWNPNNNHLINTANFPDVPDAFWNQLITYGTFIEVEPGQTVPKSDWEMIFRPQG